MLRLAMSGERFKGNRFNIDNVMIEPAALRGEIPPFWVGAVTELAMKRVGRVGDGWIISFAQYLLELESKAANYKSIAAEHGWASDAGRAYRARPLEEPRASLTSSKGAGWQQLSLPRQDVRPPIGAVRRSLPLRCRSAQGPARKGKGYVGVP